MDRPGNYRAVLFDLDGVLMDSERVTFRLWGDYLRERHGIRLEPRHYMEACGTTADLRFHEGVKYHFPEADTEGMLAHWADKLIQLARRGGVAIKPGYGELTRFLQGSGLRRGIVTANGSEWMRCYLEQLEAARRFDVIITADDLDLDRLKPHPDAYLMAAERLGVPPEECLVFEDASIGIEAALAAGMAVARMRDIAPVGPELLARCVGEFDSLTQVTEYLREITAVNL